MHWDTLEMQMNPDGTSSWQVKFIQMTHKGDILAGTGSGTGDAPNSRGITKGKGGDDNNTVATTGGLEWQEMDLRG